MASGHVNRIKRPNTWLHRPMLQNVKKVLANPEPSTHGTFRTCVGSMMMSVSRVPAQPVDATQALNLSAGVSNCKVSRGRSFILACHLGQHHVTRLTLDQGPDVGVVRPGQQIALPMARHRRIFSRRRSVTD